MTTELPEQQAGSPTDPAQGPTTSRGLWSLFARAITKPRTAAIVVAVGLVALLALVAVPFGPESESAASRLPANAESQQFNDLVATQGEAQDPTVLAVVTRADGDKLLATDKAALEDVPDRVTALNLPGMADQTIAGLQSADGKATLFVIPIDAGTPDDQIAPAVDRISEAVTEELPAGLTAEFTGGPAFSADIGRAFEGADFRLLLATVVVVVILLLLTYRSPILWFFPVFIIGLTDGAAGKLAPVIAQITGTEASPDVSGITSILVFGAGANYSLLLISRYREELQRTTDRRAALTQAVMGAGPAILASNITVVLALLMLAFAQLPGSQSLGVIAGILLLFTVVSVGLLLPAVLALLPRSIFWPLVPRPDTAAIAPQSLWARIATRVYDNPIRTAIASLAVLAFLATGLFGASFGLTQTQQFRDTPASVTGAETLAEHFDAAAGSPIEALVPKDEEADLRAAISETPGVNSVQPARRGGPPTEDAPAADATDSDWAQLVINTNAEPSSEQAFEVVQAVRDTLASATNSTTYVGGPDAEELDSRKASWADLQLIVPLILLVVFVVLLLLLRSVVAPVLLLATTTVSALAALGAGLWFSLNVLGYPAIAVPVVLYAFLFLIALGVDYTIFLMDRCREEAKHQSTKQAMIVSVGSTGGVITSAGVVLAAVFVVLGVLPLIFLAQLGAIVCVGILLDTFLVRTIVVPALCTLLGDRVWWPSNLSRRGAGSAAE